MPENINKMVSCAKFFDMRVFADNINQFFDAYIIYLYVNITTKSENDHFISNKIVVLKVH